MLVVHATRALRDHLTHSPAHEHDTSTTTLGAWYATRLRWRRPAALLVNRATLLPLFLPLAPAATLLTRLPEAISKLLHHHAVPTVVLTAERRAMNQIRVAPTADRSTVGVLNEFARLADWHRADTDNLLELSLLLGAHTARPALPAPRQP